MWEYNTPYTEQRGLAHPCSNNTPKKLWPQAHPDFRDTKQAVGNHLRRISAATRPTAQSSDRSHWQIPINASERTYPTAYSLGTSTWVSSSHSKSTNSNQNTIYPSQTCFTSRLPCAGTAEQHHLFVKLSNSYPLCPVNP